MIGRDIVQREAALAAAEAQGLVWREERPTGLDRVSD
jgi:hypothetical protein